MGLWRKILFYLGLVDEDGPVPDSALVDNAGGDSIRVGSGGGGSERDERRRAAGRHPSAGRGPGDTDPTLTTGERIARHRRSEPESATRPRPGGVAGRRVEPPMVPRRRSAADSPLSDSGVVVTPGSKPLVTAVGDEDLESQVIVARSYTDAQALADHIRAAIPVVLDLRKVEPAMVRRLVDFASGLTYALGGTMRKIGQGVLLVTPANVHISREERRRLIDLGYHQAPDEA